MEKSNEKRICSVEGCERLVIAKGYCPKHYKRFNKYGDPLYVQVELHGMSKYPEYSVWKGMKNRCGNPNVERFSRYGGRGIIVCDRWKNSFPAFYKDMGKRPTLKHQIDRINNDGNYEPGNCQWITIVENNRKRDFSRLDLQKASEIRFIYKAGNILQQQLADIYNVTKTNIRNILKNKIWKEAI